MSICEADCKPYDASTWHLLPEQPSSRSTSSKEQTKMQKKLCCGAHVASSGQKLPCRTLMRSSRGPWLRSRHCRERTRRCCAAARLCSSRS